MIRKGLAALLAVCAIGGIAASGASATSEYFYYNQPLAVEQAVSSKPSNTLYFVGGYKGSYGEFGVGVCNLIGCGAGFNEAYSTGTSLTISVGPGRGLIKNWTGHRENFTAEIRY